MPLVLAATDGVGADCAAGVGGMVMESGAGTGDGVVAVLAEVPASAFGAAITYCNY